MTHGPTPPKATRPIRQVPGYRTGQQVKAEYGLTQTSGPSRTRRATGSHRKELDAAAQPNPTAAVDLRGCSPSATAAIRISRPRQCSNEVLLNTFLVFGGHGRQNAAVPADVFHADRLSIIAGGTVVNEIVGLPYDITRERAVATAAKARGGHVVFTTPNNRRERDPVRCDPAVAEANPGQPGARR